MPPQSLSSSTFLFALTTLVFTPIKRDAGRQRVPRDASVYHMKTIVVKGIFGFIQFMPAPAKFIAGRAWMRHDSSLHYTPLSKQASFRRRGGSGQPLFHRCW